MKATIKIIICKFVRSYQTLRNKSHIVRKFSYLLLCGFLINATFVFIVSALFPKLTESLDTTKNLNCYYLVSKPQRATAKPCTTRTLKASHSFVDDYSKRGLKVERRIEVESQRKVQVLKFDIEAFKRVRLKGALKPGCISH